MAFESWLRPLSFCPRLVELWPWSPRGLFQSGAVGFGGRNERRRCSSVRLHKASRFQ